MSQPHQSLLSLSIAAASAVPISPSPVVESARASQGGASTNATKHRRLSSTGRSRRRLSDARDAATRPFPTSLQTASASFAALSLSSPTVSHRSVLGGAQPAKVLPQATSSTVATTEPEPANGNHTPSPSHIPLASNSVNVAKSGRKRGSIFTCESCSKVYRHPSCLIKHRWEHTPQWREASKFVLSKHQQVQLLEAAAILSHLSPSSASLPEDRSLWPSFLSGGLVPPPTLESNGDVRPPPMTTTVAASSPVFASDVHTPFPISSSVPTSVVSSSHRAGSTGPRIHDYALGIEEIGVTQIRPRMLSIPTAPTTSMNGNSSPMPMPAQTTTEDDALNLLALSSGTSASVPLSPSLLSHSRAHSHSYSTRSRTRMHSHSLSLSYTPNSSGGWSLPHSSLRSQSGSSGSRSPSQSVLESRSEDEDESVADLEDGCETGMRQARVYGSRMSLWKAEDQEGGVTRITLPEDLHEHSADDKGVRKRVEQAWDGMEMEMEMD